MGALFVLAGILVGLAVYRSGEARARWQSLRAARTTARNQRNTAWRHTSSAVLLLLERSSSYSLFSSSSSRPWSPTSGACGLLAWKISIRRSDLPLPAGSQARAFAPLASPMLDPLALASSSRSQVQTQTASAVARLAWDRPSGGVRWRPPLAVVIVTHLVTRPLASRCSQRLFRRSSRASLRPVTLQLSDQHASPWMTALLLPYSLDRAGSGEDAHTSTHTDYRKRHSTLR